MNISICKKRNALADLIVKINNSCVDLSSNTSVECGYRESAFALGNKGIFEKKLRQYSQKLKDKLK